MSEFLIEVYIRPIASSKINSGEDEEPACFSEAERRVIERAGQDAGIEVSFVNV